MGRALVAYSEPFRSYVELELKRSGARLLETLAPGVALITFEQPFPQLALRWKARPPVYLRHLVPVDLELADPRQAVRRLCSRLERGRPVQVQLRSLGWARDELLQNELERLVRSITRLPVTGSQPAQVLHLTLTDRGCYAGIAPRCWTLDSWPPLIPDDPWRINRAELKIQEALQVFRARLEPGTRALDLGASPGGWTRILLRHGLEVTAVDPHPRGMDPHVATHPRLHYHPLRAEDYLQLPGPRFDLITCDMYLPARRSAELLVRASSRLAAGGRVLANLKIGHPRRHYALVGALKTLREAYRIPRMRQLYFNRSELTVWMIRLDDPGQLEQDNHAQRNAHQP